MVCGLRETASAPSYASFAYGGIPQTPRVKLLKDFALKNFGAHSLA